MWQGSRSSLDRTHHVKDGRPIYAARFEEVLAFHEPGLAPVRRGTEWFHIREDGKPAYKFRFDRAFGFYEGLAAVVKDGTSHHILPTGEPAYANRLAWCGNFQEGRCPVRDPEGRYFHVLSDGTPAYVDRYAYVGDFREGAAVVFGADRMAWHIDEKGRALNGIKFLELGPFHKGIAPAKDAGGWFHVDREGKPLYEGRFSVVEQFYNGVAWAESSDGARVLIDEGGKLVRSSVVSRQRARVVRNSKVGRSMVVDNGVAWFMDRYARFHELYHRGEVYDAVGVHAEAFRALVVLLGELHSVKTEGHTLPLIIDELPDRLGNQVLHLGPTDDANECDSRLRVLYQILLNELQRSRAANPTVRETAIRLGNGVNRR